MAYMGKVVGACTLIFLGIVTFLFWLSGVSEKKGHSGGAEAMEMPQPVLTNTDGGEVLAKDFGVDTIRENLSLRRKDKE
jgi:hypothetical protein